MVYISGGHVSTY